MADIFETEDLVDDAGAISDPPEPQSPVKIVIEEAEEIINDPSDYTNYFPEQEHRSEMTLQEKEDSNPFADFLFLNPDDPLPPSLKLDKKYTQSEVPISRQTLIRNLMEVLRAVYGEVDDIFRVVSLMVKLSEDMDPVVRSELVGQIPQIAAFFKEKGCSLGNLWQILINSLEADNAQVRKTAYTSLLTVLEEKLIDAETVTQKVCPLVIHLTEPMHSEDLRNDSILLISKMAVLLGKQITEELFLPCLLALCDDKVCCIKKMCAFALGEICNTVGRETTEEKVLPKFLELCSDTAWSVRKACAENFMPVSCMVSRETRCNELADVYITFLNDLSRWVRIAAYQSLGPFISTFAEPEKTGLYYSKDGVLTINIPDPSVQDCQVSCERLVNDDLSEQNCQSKQRNPAECCDGTASKPISVSDSINCELESHGDSFCDRLSEQQVVEEFAKPINDEKIKLSSCVLDFSTSQSSNSMCNKFLNQTSQSHSNTSSSCGVSHSERSSLYSSLNKINDSCNITQAKKAKKFSSVYTHASEIPSVPCHVGSFSSSVETPTTSVDIEDDPLNQMPLVNGRLRLFDEDIDPQSNQPNEKPESNAKCDQFSHSLTSSKACDSKQKTDSELDSTICDDFESNKDNCSQVLVNGDIDAVSMDGLNGCFLSCNSCDSIVWSDHPAISEAGKAANCCFCGKTVVNLSNGPVNSANHASSQKSESGAGICREIMSCDHSDSNNISFSHSSKSRRAGLYEESNNSGYSNCSESWSDVHVDSAFNHFQYWRQPVDDIEIEVITASDYELSSSRSREIDRYKRTDPSYFGIRSRFERNRQDPDENFTILKQDIVPASLLSLYLGMIDTYTEVAHHCAYSLPAVAFTLGRQNWSCLRGTFNELSSDLRNFVMMWKIRRTVASSMHQLAVILGPEITSIDLIPVFSKFIYDLDEVRIGVLQHISEFLQVLQPEERKAFLPELSVFLTPITHAESNESSDKNWRFRLVLAEQLVPVADLYEPLEVSEHLVPLAITLLKDKICEVRLASVRVMAACVRRMSQYPTADLTKAVLGNLTQNFIHSSKWIHRQLFVYVCQEFIVKNSLPPEQFAEDVLPHLLYLCWDRVPNIRLATARCLATVIWPLDAFSSPESPYRELLLQAIHTLQGDRDADVQYYACMVSTHDCSCLTHDVFPNLPV